ncbi:MAG: HAD family phosphatase [Chloroflexi bacterium]|nr:HAD family phosphatase [Chloroflexota bacterium]
MTNHQYKLLVLDIDGTLLDKNGTISAEDKEALAKAANAGIRVSLSTGRVVQSSLKIIKQLSLDGCHIFFDGALVYDLEKNEEVYIKPISREIVRQMVDFVHLSDINIELYSATRFFVEQESWRSDIRRQFFNLKPTVVDFDKVWPGESIIKGTLLTRSDEDKAKAKSFRQHFKNSLTFSLTKTPAYPEVDFINVIDLGVSKGNALAALASHLGIPLSEVMAIGDGGNDASLLSRAGLAVAMGNATDELKRLADYVTLTIDNHGVTAAVNKFLLSSL